MSTEHWTPWFKHDGGPCPIPEVKAGNWWWRTADDAEGVAARLHADDDPDWEAEHTITAFRLRTDPDGWIPHKADDPCPVAGDLLIDFKTKCVMFSYHARAVHWGVGTVVTHWRPHNWPLAEPIDDAACLAHPKTVCDGTCARCPAEKTTAKPKLLRVTENYAGNYYLWDGEYYLTASRHRVCVQGEAFAEVMQPSIGKQGWRLLVPDWPHRAKASTQSVIVPEPSAESLREEARHRDMLIRDAAGADRSEWRDKVRGLLAESAACPVRSPLQTVAPMERMAGSTRWGAV